MSGLPNVRTLLPLLAVVVAINFITMPAEEYRGDAESVRVETVMLLTEGKWAVPESMALQFGPRGSYFFQNATGAWYPKYGPLNTLIYLPPLWLEKVATGKLNFDTEHTLWLNLLNFLLSAATATYLALLALRYTKSVVIVWLFVLASLYGTFWWNYLRAHSFETYLPLFTLAFFYHLVTADDRRRMLHLAWAGIFLGLLCLCKIAFVVFVLVPIFLLVREDGKKLSRWWAFLAPVVFAGVLLLYANWYRFGSPWQSGYTQWEKERVLFTWHVWPAIRGYLFDPTKSLFVHFPPVIFALAAWPFFYKQRRLDARVALSLFFLLFAISVAVPFWSGASCYGPRYLLPVLPLLSLPFINVLEWLGNLNRPGLRWLAGGVIALLLGWSFLLQVAVNSLPFYFWYDLSAIADDDESTAGGYLDTHPFGAINLDFIRYARSGSPRFANEFAGKLSPTAFGRLEALKMETRFNYYWFRYSVEPGP